jgi:hypothetical protein
VPARSEQSNRRQAEGAANTEIRIDIQERLVDDKARFADRAGKERFAGRGIAARLRGLREHRSLRAMRLTG